MSWVKGRGHDALGLNADPPCYPGVTAGNGGWRPFMPNATGNTQVGQYEHPPLSQYPAYWPDTQLNCGVNGMSRSWNVLTAHGADKPYFQMTPYPMNPKHLIQSGMRSGGVQQMVIMSESFVPRAYAQGVQQSAVANGVVGW